jgi:hypothetical protein
MTSSKNKKGRNLLLLLLLMIVIIGALTWLMNYNKQKETSESETSEETTTIATIDTTTLNTIHYSMPDSEMTLILDEDGIWHNYLDEEYPINQTYAANMADAFANITATRTITEGIDNLADFGLEEPAATISATLEDGTTIIVKFGSQVPVVGGYYATLNNDEKVYILSDTFYSTFNYTTIQMTEVEKIPSITAENITKLSIDNKEKQNFEVVYDEESPADLSGFSNYIINKPYSTPVPADADAITALFGNYSAMSFSSCVDYNAADLSKYGLEEPSSKINISYYEELTQETDTTETESGDSGEEAQGITKVNHELTLFIGGTNENGDYYAKLSDSNAVGIISASTVSTLTEIDAYENSYKYINLVNIDAVNSMEISIGEEIFNITINRSTETVDGEESQVATYYLNEKEMKEDDFKTLYQVIIGPVTEREIAKDENISLDSPYMTVTYHLLTSEEPLIIKFLPYDQNYYVVNTNGAQNFLTDIRKIIEIADNLKAADEKK